MRTDPVTLPRRASLLRLLLHTDPRAAMLIFAMHMATFGAAILGDVAARRLATTSNIVIGSTVYQAFEVVPPWLVGTLFEVSAVALVVGVTRGRMWLIRYGALWGMALWIFSFVSIAVVPAFGGVWFLPAWARYGSPVLASWWVYLRAPAAGVWWRPVRTPRTWRTALVLLPPVFVAEAIVDGAHAALSDVVAAAAVGGAVTLLVAVAKTIADRIKARQSSVALESGHAIQRDQFLWGITVDQLQRALDRVAHLEHAYKAMQDQWSARERQIEEANAFCRAHCDLFRNRPAA